MGHLVVGLDGSPASAAALRWAVAESGRRRARLLVVHAYLAPFAYSGSEEVVAAIDPELHHAVLDDLRGFLAAADVDLGEVDLREQLHPGRAADGLLRAARGADLLVVGRRGAGGFEGLLLGKTADACARRAPCPIVVVPAAPSAGSDHVVAGIGDAATAPSVLRWALQHATRAGATVTAVSAYEPYDARGPFGGRFMDVASPGARDRFRHQAQERLDGALHAVGEAHPPIDTIVDAGHPAKVLIERGATADLLVVGRRAHAGEPWHSLGSVSKQVLHHAACAVAIVPPPPSLPSSTATD